MIIAQWLLIIVSVVALAKVLFGKEHRRAEIVFWSAVWIGLLVFSIWPKITSYIATFVGVGKGTDAIVYASIIVLFYVLFQLNLRIEENNKRITELVRAIALENAKNGGKKNE